MTAYTIPEINNGVAKIQWSDGSWTHIELTSDMTEADLDDLVHIHIPPHLRTGSAPSFLSEGTSRTAAPKAPVIPEPAWLSARKEAYGDLESQVEYITENGLSAWQTHVAEIKAANPKTE